MSDSQPEPSSDNAPVERLDAKQRMFSIVRTIGIYVLYVHGFYWILAAIFANAPWSEFPLMPLILLIGAASIAAGYFLSHPEAWCEVKTLPRDFPKYLDRLQSVWRKPPPPARRSRGAKGGK